MFSGTKIEIDGNEYVVPALSLGQLRNGILTKLQQHDSLIAENKTYEAIALRGEVIFAALQRNYPDFDENKFMSWLDVENSQKLWLQVLGLSGFQPGETPAVAMAANGTSSPSIEA